MITQQISSELTFLTPLSDTMISLTNKEELTFLDIETTGLSKEKHVIYLIGILRIFKNKAHYLQLLSQNEEEEVILLQTFLEKVKHVPYFYTYNGRSFDLPFLVHKLKVYQLDPVTPLKTIDLYSIANSLKRLLHTPNLKQRTLEEYLGIHRKDLYSGRELIEEYKKYIDSSSKSIEYHLLHHNKNDLFGMKELLLLFNYVDFFTLSPLLVTSKQQAYRKFNTEETAYELILDAQFTFFSPTSISFQGEYFYLKLKDNHLFFVLPLTEQTLKYFYPNPKNYYYLPLEDIAIHKSVGQFVDPAHRKKANSANCYTKKTGFFLPATNTDEYLLFSNQYKDKERYIEFKGEELSQPAECLSLFLYYRRWISNIIGIKK